MKTFENVVRLFTVSTLAGCASVLLLLQYRSGNVSNLVFLSGVTAALLLFGVVFIQSDAFGLMPGLARRANLGFEKLLGSLLIPAAGVVFLCAELLRVGASLS